MRPEDRHVEDGLRNAGEEDPCPRVLEGPPKEKRGVAPAGDVEKAEEASPMGPRDGGHCRKFGIFPLLLVSIISFVAAIILYTGNVVDNLIQQNTVIRSGSQHYEWWKNPPVGTLVKITLFNYTNADNYLKRIDRKLKVTEVGPFVYRLRVNKVNVEFPETSGGDIVSFQVNKTYEFAPELSPGVSGDEIIVTPNFNLLGLASLMHDSSFGVKMALNRILSFIRSEPFLRLPADELLWGYDDPIFDHGRKFVSSERGDLPMEKFGLLAKENSLSPHQISIHTGLRDRSQLGVLSAYDEEDSLPYWGGGECNRVDGSEGSVFPRTPATTRYDPEGDPLQTHVFSYHLCRRLPIQQKEEVLASGGIPTIRFEPPPGVYDSPLTRPEHRCFCDPERSYCPPSGVFNVSPCAYGAPVMISYPHFHSGDPSLVEHFEGLKPTTKHHEFYLDIEPTLGVPLKVKSAFQMNAMVRPTWAIKELSAFPQNLIMPLLWVQSVTEEVPDYLVARIKLVTQTSYLVEKIVMCVLFAMGMALMAVAVARIFTDIRRFLRELTELRVSVDDDPRVENVHQLHGG